MSWSFHAFTSGTVHPSSIWLINDDATTRLIGTLAHDLVSEAQVAAWGVFRLGHGLTLRDIALGGSVGTKRLPALPGAVLKQSTCAISAGIGGGPDLSPASRRYPVLGGTRCPSSPPGRPERGSYRAADARGSTGHNRDFERSRMVGQIDTIGGTARSSPLPPSQLG